ncbi:MAG: type 1 glutamine amidotransferase [Pseudomonadota bacterium]
MRVLVLQNHEFGPVGLIGERLTLHGLEQVTVHAWQDESVPDEVGSYAGMVVLGGAQSAFDFETWPYLADEAALIRRFAEADRPVLGICLGAQLVARAHGAEVRRHRALEIGYSPIQMTEAAVNDPVFKGAEPSPQMQWHYDTFDLPDGAVLLATNDFCRNQAIRVGRAHYGLQFHSEADPAIIASWLAEGTKEAERAQPGCVDEIHKGMAAHADRAPVFASQLIDAWIGLL